MTAILDIPYVDEVDNTTFTYDPLDVTLFPSRGPLDPQNGYDPLGNIIAMPTIDPLNTVGIEDIQEPAGPTDSNYDGAFSDVESPEPDRWSPAAYIIRERWEGTSPVEKTGTQSGLSEPTLFDSVKSQVNLNVGALVLAAIAGFFIVRELQR